jgi:hypothetical protein
MFEFTYVDVDMSTANKLVERTVRGTVVDQGRHYMIVRTSEGTLPIPRSCLLGWKAYEL